MEKFMEEINRLAGVDDYDQTYVSLDDDDVPDRVFINTGIWVEDLQAAWTGVIDIDHALIDGKPDAEVVILAQQLYAAALVDKPAVVSVEP